jgi:hypothetical protein
MAKNGMKWVKRIFSKTPKTTTNSDAGKNFRFFKEVFGQTKSMINEIMEMTTAPGIK